MAFTYKIYAQGGTHVLATLSDDTLIGERTFNPGRLEAQEGSALNTIKLVDLVTDDTVLNSVTNDVLLNESGNVWAAEYRGSIAALNEFFQTAVYNITQIDGIPTPSAAGYLKWDTVSGYVWAPITGSSPAGYITALQDDDSPVLGGNLTVNNNTIGINETVEVSNNLKLTSRTTPPTANAGGMYYNSSSDAFFVALES